MSSYGMPQLDAFLKRDLFIENLLLLPESSTIQWYRFRGSLRMVSLVAAAHLRGRATKTTKKLRGE